MSTKAQFGYALLSTNVKSLNGGVDPYYLYNISSKNPRKTWTKAGSLAIKQEINKRQWQRTIIITVNRLSTGVSIPEWDSVILANSCQSLTRRIQAYGRVETPRVEIIGEGKSKYCLKPNCFVIDLNPEQLYEFCFQQEEHSQSLGGKDCGNPLASSSVYACMPWNGEMVMRELTRHGIHQQLDKCYMERDISTLGSNIDNIGSLPISDELRELISVDKTSSKSSVGISALGEETAKRELEVTLSDMADSKENVVTAALPAVETKGETVEQKRDDTLRREFIYKRVLLFAAVTGKADNLGQLIKLFDTDLDARKIAINLGLLPLFIVALKKVNEKTLVNDRLGRSMKAVSTRSKESLEEHMAVVAGLGVLSSNEILTSTKVAQQLTEKLAMNEDDLLANILDLACKTGAMLLAFYNRLEQLIQLALKDELINAIEAQEFSSNLNGNLYAIPTGSATYEIVKSLYKRMSWKESNILWCEEAPLSWQQNWAYTIAQLTPALIVASQLNRKEALIAVSKIALKQSGYSILKAEDKTQVIEFLLRLAKIMSEQFDYVISNPPYQISKSDNSNKAFPIYPDFIDAARQIGKTSIMIHRFRF